MYIVYWCVFWLPPGDPGPRGERVLTVGAWGGGVWLSRHRCHPRVEKPDHAGHEPQLHQHHRQLCGETRPPNLNTTRTAFSACTDWSASCCIRMWYDHLCLNTGLKEGLGSIRLFLCADTEIFLCRRNWFQRWSFWIWATTSCPQWKTSRYVCVCTWWT